MSLSDQNHYNRIFKNRTEFILRSFHWNPRPREVTATHSSYAWHPWYSTFPTFLKTWHVRPRGFVRCKFWCFDHSLRRRSHIDDPESLPLRQIGILHNLINSVKFHKRRRRRIHFFGSHFLEMVRFSGRCTQRSYIAAIRLFIQNLRSNLLSVFAGTILRRFLMAPLLEQSWTPQPW